MHRCFATISASLCIFALFACGPLTPDGIDNENSALRWSELPISYRISQEIPEAFHPEIHAGFELWEQETGLNLFEYEGIADVGQDELNNGNHPLQNVVFAVDNAGIALTDEIDALARTLLHGGSRIRDADIVMFRFAENFIEGRGEHRDVYSITSVVAHEVGHMLLGVEHSKSRQSVFHSTLYPIDHENHQFGLATEDKERFFEVYQDII